jgi:hypothetical protein
MRRHKGRREVAAAVAHAFSGPPGGPARSALRTLLFALVVTLLVFAPGLRGADILPNRLADAAFWELIERTSESGGVFQSENFLSNETGFQAVIPTLKEMTRPEGVYMGVGPEQNFTYIAAIHPKIAFIVDIRRQNMLEHLLYKAMFELSANRADFLSRLFARKRPSGLSDQSSVSDLFRAYQSVSGDEELFKANLQEINDLLLRTHKFGLTPDDAVGIEHVYSVFRDFGPDINYNSGAGRRGGNGMPNYVVLMTATDLQGEQRSYLANEENYRFIRDLEGRNLIVPLAGDFGGKKAIRAVGQYVKDHNATVTAFYLSNVERYLFQPTGPNQNGGWTNFYENVATLPLDPSSTFIRSVGGSVPGGPGGMRLPNVLSSMQDTLAAVESGRIQTYNDVVSISR